MVLQFVMGVNARLRPTPLCTAFVPGECKASLVQVYRSVHYIMQQLGWESAFRRIQLFVSDSALGAVRAHRSLSHDRAFGGEAIVLVVRLVCRGLASVRRLCCLVVLTMHHVVLRRVEVDA
jgi:hypothetical protein